MASEVIKEFLVSLGYKVDEASAKRFSEALTTIHKTILGVGAAAAAAAATLAVSVDKMTGRLDSLYWKAAKSNISVTGIKRLEYAFKQAGASAEDADSAIQGLSTFLKKPGSFRFLQSLGVQITDANGKFKSTEEYLVGIGEALKKQPYSKALVIADRLGLNEDQLLALERGVDKYRDKYNDILGKSGANPDEAALKSVELQRKITDLEAHIDVLKTKLLSDFLDQYGPKIEQIFKYLVDHFDDIVKGIEKVVDKLFEFADGVDSVAKAMGGWQTVGEAILAYFTVTWAVGMVAAIGKVTAGLAPLLPMLARIAILEQTYEAAHKFGEKIYKEIEGTRAGDAIGDYIGQEILGITPQQVAQGRGADFDAIKHAGNYALDAINPFSGVKNLVNRFITPKAASADLSAPAVKDRVKTALDKFVSAGYTQEQAAGFVGGLLRESSTLNTGEIGDNGQAFGIAQWHPDRQAEFQAATGKNIRGSSFAEQLDFILYELSHKESAAGAALKRARTAAEAAAAQVAYERPADQVGESYRRAQVASQLLSDPTVWAGKGGATINQTTNFYVTGNGDNEATSSAIANKQDQVNAGIQRRAQGHTR